MDFKIWGKEFTVGTKTTVVKEKKSFIGSYNYSNLGQLIDWGVQISVQTFYDLYKKNPDIRQCIRKISNSVSRDGIYLENNEWEIVDDNILTDEIFDYFKSPTFLKFKTDLERNYLLSGDLYITPLRNLKQEIVAFQVLDTRGIQKKINDQWNIIGYEQYTRTGAVKKYRVEDMAYFQFEVDVNNANFGMGLLHGIVYDALSDLQASKVNHMIYENWAIPDFMLLLNDTLTNDEMKLAKEQFDSQYRGSMNAHKTLVGWGIKDIKQLSLNHRDMEFLNQKKFTIEKVATAFGVPKSILWYVDNVNYANAKELRKEYIEWTIRPFEQDFEHILNVLTSKFLPEIYEKYWVRCKGETLDDQDVIAENHRKDLDKWVMTINEVRVARGMEGLEEENADKPLVSRNTVLLEDVALDAVLSPNETNNGGGNESQEDTE